MKQSDYDYYNDSGNSYVLCRSRVAEAISSAPGQAFLHEMLETLDMMHDKELIAFDLMNNGKVCVLGALCAKRNISIKELTAAADDNEFANIFGVDISLISLIDEIQSVNDEYPSQRARDRWLRVRKWAVENLKDKENSDG